VVVKPKWEWKYILGRPNVEIPIAESEQALWVSDNPDIAIVYKGMVTGYKAGIGGLKLVSVAAFTYPSVKFLSNNRLIQSCLLCRTRDMKSSPLPMR